MQPPTLGGIVIAQVSCLIRNRQSGCIVSDFINREIPTWVLILRQQREVSLERRNCCLKTHSITKELVLYQNASALRQIKKIRPDNQYSNHNMTSLL